MVLKEGVGHRQLTLARPTFPGQGDVTGGGRLGRGGWMMVGGGWVVAFHGHGGQPAASACAPYSPGARGDVAWGEAGTERKLGDGREMVVG